MSNNMDEHREAQQLEMIAVPRWLLDGAVFCALLVSRHPPGGDGGDMMWQLAEEMLERAPADVDDLTAQFDCTGEYAQYAEDACEECGSPDTTTQCSDGPALCDEHRPNASISKQDGSDN